MKDFLRTVKIGTLAALALPGLAYAVEITGNKSLVHAPLPASVAAESADLTVSDTQATAPLVPALPPVGPMTPSEQQAEAAYDQAHKAYATGGTVSDGQGANAGTPGVASVVPQPYAGAGLMDGKVGSPEVVMLEDPSRRVIPGTKNPSNVALENIRLVLDVDNTTLKDVFAEVIRQAAQYTGTWTVKWRLKPEDMGLLDERVNLTAEAKFGDFVQLLTDRVRNMSGVQLFVTAFQESRVILVTDTAQ